MNDLCQAGHHVITCAILLVQVFLFTSHIFNWLLVFPNQLTFDSLANSNYTVICPVVLKKWVLPMKVIIKMGEEDTVNALTKGQKST